MRADLVQIMRHAHPRYRGEIDDGGTVAPAYAPVRWEEKRDWTEHWPAVRRALALMISEDRRVIELRYGLDRRGYKTYAAVARLMRVSHSNITRRHARAMRVIWREIKRDATRVIKVDNEARRKTIGPKHHLRDHT